MTNTTASIVLYNNPIDQIRHCIESLQVDARVHVLLVDNSENKGSYAGLAAENVEILDAPGNVGFGRGITLSWAGWRRCAPRLIWW